MSKKQLIDQENEALAEIDLPTESETDDQQKESRLKGLIFANGYSLFVSIYLIGTKMMQNHGIRFLDISFTRYVETIVLSYVVMKFAKKDVLSDITGMKEYKFIIMRTVAGLFLFNLLVVNTVFLPLFIMNIIISTNGFLASILGYYVFGDVLHWQEILGMFLGYFGIVLIVLGQDAEMTSEEQTTYLIGILIAIANSILTSLLPIITRKMKGIHFSVIQFNYNVIGTFVMAAIIASTFFVEGWRTPVDYTWLDYFVMIFVCLFNSSSQLLYTGAAQIEKAGVIAIISYSTVFYSLLADIVIFKYILTWMQLLGGFLIVIINVYLGVMKLQGKL